MRTYRRTAICLISCLLVGAIASAASSPVRAIVNGADLGPAAQGRIIDGQVMVPLRAVAKALGTDVKWDPAALCVYITTKAVTEVTQESAPAPAERKKEVTVYITNTGSRYHRLGCRYLRRVASR